MATATAPPPAAEPNARKLRGHDPKKTRPKKAKVVIFGPAGVGKTWTSLDFPDCYYIDCEGGATEPQYIEKLTESGAMYFGADDGAGDINRVIDEIQTLAMSEHDRRTVVIDSYSKLFNSAIAEEEQRLIEAGEKIAFGNEKKPAVKATRRLITWLDKIDMNVLLICHQKDKWQNGEVISQTFDGWDKLEYELDLTLQIEKQGAERLARVRKSRLAGFPDTDVFSWSYDEFARRYGRETIEGEVTHLKPSTPQQVQDLTTLLSVVKIPAATPQKWLEKAGVNQWSDMDSDTISKCIDYLKKQVEK